MRQLLFTLHMALVGIFMVEIICLSSPAKGQQTQSRRFVQRYASFKGIGLSYNQVTHLLANKFGIRDGTPVNGRRSSSGQDGYKGPFIQVVGDHDDVWEAGLAIQSPKNVDKEIMMANTGSLLVFMKNVSPQWTDSINWLMSAMKRSQDSPGSQVSTVHHGIKYTVLYMKPKSATVLTVRRADASTDDILGSAK